MLDRMKLAARLKLQRAVDEVLTARLAESAEQARGRHDQTVAALDRSIGDVHRRLEHLEQLARRDILYSLDRAATAESAAFVVENLPAAEVFWHPHDTLRFGLSKVGAGGLALEFGVASGTTLGIIAESLSAQHTVVGFDSFAGLPETWRSGFPAGMFAVAEPPDVAGADVVIGEFDSTLPAYLSSTDEQIAFLHLDADLYSSTKTVLDHTGDRLAPGAILVFDEFFNYPGWQQHEFQAWTEFLDNTGRVPEYLAYTGNNEQVVVRLAGRG